MTTKEDLIKQFQRAIKKEYGREITKVEAIKTLNAVLDYLTLLVVELPYRNRDEAGNATTKRARR